MLHYHQDHLSCYLAGVVVRRHHNPCRPDQHAAALDLCHKRVMVSPVFQPLLLIPLWMQIIQENCLVSLIFLLISVPPFRELFFEPPRIFSVDVEALPRARGPKNPGVVQVVKP